MVYSILTKKAEIRDSGCLPIKYDFNKKQKQKKGRRKSGRER